MLYEKQGNRIPKKTAEKLAKFSYYVDTFLPDLFQIQKNGLDFEKKATKPLNQLLSKTGNRNLSYNYFYSQCENSAAINADSILSSVKKLYLNQDVIKINEMSYSRESIFKQSYLPVYGYFSEIIDFVLIAEKDDKSQNSDKNKSLATTQPAFKQSLTSNLGEVNSGNENNKTSKTSVKPKEYWLYVIHNCNSFMPQSDKLRKISWQHFVQRFHFIEKDLTDDKSKSLIEYELVYSFKSSSSFIDFQQNLTKLFIQSHCKIVQPQNTLQSLLKLQGYLLQRSSQVEAHIQKQKDIAFSDEHRRQTKIPIEYFKQYLALKKEVYQFYMKLNNCDSQDEINKYFYQNLVCRYLIAKEYDFSEAKKSILEYLNWEKQMKDKYPSLQCFKQYHSIGAYQYLGEDFMGRPVILSKSARIDVNKLASIQMYCDYYIYFLEIYMRSKMRGYVDQMLVIGDLTDLGSKNFKIAITKRNVSDSLKYGPERQLGLMIVNAGTFAYTAWTFIKPLLPKKTLHKIEICGHNKKQIVASLSTRMDVSVIPQYLGGQNMSFQQQFKKTLNFDAAQNQKQTSFFQSNNKNSTAKKADKSTVNAEIQGFQQIEMKTTESRIDEIKKSNNVIYNLLESVTKTFGFSFGD